MGCNTSKDTVKPPEEENNKQQDGHVRTPEEGKEVRESPAEVKEQSDDKPPSARTITLKSASDERTSGAKNPEDAATKIQAAFRGHYTRQTIKKGQTDQKEETMEQEHQSPSQPAIDDDTELEQAATKIQASFRGHMVRKQIEKDEQKVADAIATDNSELDNIDLTDPELNKAATKIQASFRGHVVRKEAEHPQNE